MKTKETLKSSREIALEWWYLLDWETRYYYSNKLVNKIPTLLTGREIQEIWEKETIKIENKVFKPNEKQFKEFNSELARKYLNKFDNNAKKHFVLETCNMLSKTDLQYLKACITEIISEK